MSETELYFMDNLNLPNAYEWADNVLTLQCVDEETGEVIDETFISWPLDVEAVYTAIKDIYADMALMGWMDACRGKGAVDRPFRFESNDTIGHINVFNFNGVLITSYNWPKESPPRDGLIDVMREAWDEGYTS